MLLPSLLEWNGIHDSIGIDALRHLSFKIKKCISKLKKIMWASCVHMTRGSVVSTTHFSPSFKREIIYFFLIEPRETHEFQVVILKTHNWIFASFLLSATVSKGRKSLKIKPSSSGSFSWARWEVERLKRWWREYRKLQIEKKKQIVVKGFLVWDPNFLSIH